MSFISCLDKSSVNEFNKFQNWAIFINSQDPAYIYAKLDGFYEDLQAKSSNLQSLPQSPPAENLKTVTPGWLDLQAYDLSKGLLDNFFDPDGKNWFPEVKGNTYELAPEWRDKYLEKMTTNGQYDVKKASVFIDVEHITVTPVANGRFIHPYNGSGRHRLMALKALGAPTAPVVLLTQGT